MHVFEGSIQVQCRQKRYGTLVCHKHCDLIQALTTALAKNNNNQQASASSATCDGTCSSHTCSTLSIEEQACNVARFLWCLFLGRRILRGLAYGHNITPYYAYLHTLLCIYRQFMCCCTDQNVTQVSIGKHVLLVI